ncbi:MAG: hypothetical protein DME08_19145 [Candidatus Rokuibacteriota bacterium]|nr:MAG: hypothetical protein DME08_19145 [Candidatus Rokubacteria bacterium]
MGSSPWYCHQIPSACPPPRQKRGALYHSNSHQPAIETSATSTSSERAVVRYERPVRRATSASMNNT